MLNNNKKNNSKNNKNNKKIRRIINIKWFQNKKMRNFNKNQKQIQLIKIITKNIKITIIIKTKAILIKINKQIKNKQMKTKKISLTKLTKINENILNKI